MKRFSNALQFLQRDIGLRLFVLYLLFVGPLLIGALVVNNFARNRLRSEIQSADLDIANVVSREFNNHLNDFLELTDLLAHHSAVLNQDPKGMEELFRTVTIGRSNISVIYLMDPDCRLVYSYRPGIGGEKLAGMDLQDNPLCRIETAESAISPGHISLISGQPVATVAQQVVSLIGLERIGWVAIDIRLNALNQLAQLSVQHRPDEDYEVLILDEGGAVIARSDFNTRALLIDGYEQIPLLDRQEDPAGAAGWIALDGTGSEILFSSAPIESAGWQVVISHPAAGAFSIPQAFSRGLIFSVFLFLIVGLFFWMILSRNVIQPLELLAEHSRRLAPKPLRGEPGLHVDVQKPDEQILSLQSRTDQIGHLVRSLIRADEAIQARFNELEKLLETGAVVLSSLDINTVLSRILAEVERLMGLENSAIIALDERRGVFLGKASRGLSRRYTDQIVIHPSEPASITLRALETGQAVQISDIETDVTRVALKPRARKEGIRALIAVPLKVKHSPPTALLVYHNEPHVFTMREVNLLTSFAQQAAMALENATLHSRSDLQLEEQTLRLEALIQSMRDGLIMEDLQGRVLYANRMTEDLTGLTQQQAIGRPVEELIRRIIDLTLEPEKTRNAIQEAVTRVQNRQVDLEFKAPQGNLRFLRLRIFDVTDSHGEVIGRGRILHDITRRREIDRMRSSLVSTVSHELRTPLASIKGYATTLLSDDVEWDTVSQREFLSIISQETDRLTELVKDLLDMSRIEAGNLSISRVSADISEIIPRAALRARTPPERLVLDISSDVPPLYIDPQRIEVVFRNLIENAVKYSAETSPIRISAKKDTDEVVIRVEDQGVGVPPQLQQRIFDSFYRVENGFTRSTTGAGLGLAISQGFIRAHGGRIWYEPLTNGSCFTFTLPLNLRESP